jgi:signal recognition particle subunit SRP54
MTSNFFHSVAATKSPIVFIGTGEHLDDLEPFVAQRFVGKMLGLGDLAGLMERAQDLNLEDNEEMMKRMSKGYVCCFRGLNVLGQFSLRDMFEQIQNIMKLGPITKLMGMIPGMSSDMLPQGSEDDIQKRFRKMLCVMDSMTNEELNSDGKIFVNQPTRVLRVSRGAGVLPEEFEMIFKWHKFLSQTLKSLGGNKEMMNMLGGGGSAAGALGGAGRGLNPGRMNPAQMARMQQQMRSNPQIQQMAQRMGLGGMDINQMMQQLQGGGMPDLSMLGNLMGGMGRGRGGRK